MLEYKAGDDESKTYIQYDTTTDRVELLNTEANLLTTTSRDRILTTGVVANTEDDEEERDKTLAYYSLDTESAKDTAAKQNYAPMQIPDS